MQTEYRRRRRALADQIGPNAALLVFASPERVRSADTYHRYRPDSNLLYLTGFSEPESAMLLLPGDAGNEHVLFTRPRDPKRELWDGFRHGTEGAEKDFGADVAYDIAELAERLPQLLEGRDQLYYAFGEDTVRDAEVFVALRALRAAGRAPARGPHTLTDPAPLLHAARRLKSSVEIDALARAAEVSAHAHLLAMQEAKPGMMEYELQAIIEHEMRRLGAEGPSYASIVAGGSNACTLHYIENRSVLMDGDLVLVDAGAEVNWYAGDITRTWPVGPAFSSAQRELYEAVLEVQIDAVDRCRAGVTWRQHHEDTRRGLCKAMVRLGLLRGDVEGLLERGADRAFFMHGTGHYLGIDVHDVGVWAERDASGATVELPFEPGVAFTVEPAIYVAHDAEGVPDELRGVGIRIEDDVVITAGAPEVLTTDVPKSVVEIERLRAQACAE